MTELRIKWISLPLPTLLECWLPALSHTPHAPYFPSSSLSSPFLSDPGPHFFKGLETFWAYEAIFSPSVSK